MAEYVWKDPHGRPVPTVTADQMREVDRIMVEDYGIEVLQMMEHAGRSLAHLARSRFLQGQPQGARIVVLAGTGGNGGGALVAARRLHGWGARVRVVTTAGSAAYRGVPARQLDILSRLEVPVTPWDIDRPPGTPDLVVDGILGYSLQGEPRGVAAAMIQWVNRIAAPVLSLDLPSGLEPTTGRPSEATVLASATLTLALPKAGFANPDSHDHLGDLYLADIGVPAVLYSDRELGLDVGNLFENVDLLRLR
jgi:NAD(P)H-hydrate epimerase